MGYDDCDWPGEDAAALAYHEAGHAVAAVLCAVGWTEVRSVESRAEALETGLDGWTAYVAAHHDDTTEANRAFIAWAGCWAEARHVAPDDPWSVLPALQVDGGRGDMERVYAYWAGGGVETDEQWARELDGAWSHVEALAERVAKEGTVRTPLHPDG